ncbi:MAG: SDR family oxidoreductase [Myxococcales bacterium]|nr:SDR family oxidoreductase [Myxococcales bacterium]
MLEAIADDRALLASLSLEDRQRLLIAAGRVARPDRDEARSLARALRKKEHVARKRAEEERLDTTGIRQLRALPVFATPGPDERLLGDGDRASEEPPVTLDEARVCYVCKQRFDTLHHFYDQLCPSCGDFNFAKRTQRADLRGRTALVTGGRVKIGYQAVILLLRAGARVLVTTRFPRDAAERFAREADAPEWIDRLVVHGLDLRHTPSVELFAQHVLERESRLDFVIHNACQTVRRPAGFYAHLIERERSRDRSGPINALLSAHDALREEHALARFGAAAPSVGLTDAPGLSQLALLAEDTMRGGAIFPDGALDQDLQQVDKREHNSWRMRLHEVPTVELLEVQLVNAVAPFVLNARLKSLMTRTAERDKHIVNVSAVEGQFYREHKTDKHPHTNMAKAALNMMTRTSAQDYASDGIHMNSVDTGWVTDEDPAHIAVKKREVHGFHPPLDIVDGAARIVDPIFHGANTGEHFYGLFFKDYKPVPW